jgi:cyclopropane fatty-acyl-phospholipid synthase-like methyltransferase
MGYDERYRKTDALFGKEPDRVVAAHAHRIDPSRPVLDIGAGQGRNTIFLAEKGFTVYALEPSKVGVGAIEAAAAQKGLPVRTYRSGFESFDGPGKPYSAVLLIGLIPILRPEAIDTLLGRVEGWTAAGSFLLVTAFTTGDPEYGRHAAEWESIGRHSFRGPGGGLRTYLEPGEIKDLFGGWRLIHHWEGMGPEHRHGDGPPQRHAMTEAVFRRSREE